MISRSFLRKLWFTGTGFLSLTVCAVAMAVDDTAWQAAGTRDRNARQSTSSSADSSVASPEEVEQNKGGTPSVGSVGRAAEPRRLKGSTTGRAKPIGSSARSRAVPTSQWLDPNDTVEQPEGKARATDGSGSAHGSGSATGQVRPAVANQPRQPRQRAHRTVAYHARPYPIAPWHPHPYYASAARGSGPPARFTAKGPPPVELIGPGEFVGPEPSVLEPEPEDWTGDEFFDGHAHGPPFAPGAGCTCDGVCDCGPADSGYPLFASIFAGMQGFKGPQDLGRNGNFGFHEGFELSIPSPLRPVNMQLGMRFTQNNFAGDQVTENYRRDGREQIFLTAGLFRRGNACCPWQWGVVFDWLHDEYWVDADLSQIRVETSWLTRCGNEWGFLAAVSTGDENFDDQLIDDLDDFNFDFGAEPTDYYGIFLRRATAACGEWRLLAGVTEHSDAILGGDFWLPVGNCLALDGDFTFLIAEHSGSRGQREEAFGVGLSLVWYPYRPPRNVAGHSLRPLLPVADNARFFVNRR
ncbi:MAG: hypothetical protein GTO76_00505 [Planctomycetales bacterium]|nr:hypothetical protein [Planctomycetales bacterium]NIO33475.1 hypothetical protein [Planctomycetales bacterium]NIP03344.1 hypothetical protein [Planctomycetales bacterium]